MPSRETDSDIGSATDRAAADITTALREPQMRHLASEAAMGKQTLVLLAALNTACVSVDDLGRASAELFKRHPDYAIITSFPGLGDSTGTRVLAEIGDDRSRFVDARVLKAYAGSAPITRASGKSVSITGRRIKNARLAAAGWIWAFGAATHCRSAGEHHRRRRTRRPARRRAAEPLQQSPGPALLLSARRAGVQRVQGFQPTARLSR
jgi:transposase